MLIFNIYYLHLIKFPLINLIFIELAHYQFFKFVKELIKFLVFQNYLILIAKIKKKFKFNFKLYIY